MANIKFKNAMERKEQSTPPIWFMRQAGRYHKHYQGMKEKHTFLELCKTPELAAEVALGPIRDFDFDVSILFSDLLFPLEALGLGLDYKPGPVLDRTLNFDNIHQLRPLEEAVPYLEFQRDAVRLTRELLPQEKSLIGFIGGPWTLFTYAVEGAHKGHLIDSKTQPSLFSQFTELVVPLLKRNIELQLEGGAEVVMIFDTAAGEVSPLYYAQYIAPSLNELASAFSGRLGYYAKGTTRDHARSVTLNTDWCGFGFDHRWSLPECFGLSERGFVQGNFDQTLLFADHDQFKNILETYLKTYSSLSLKQRAGWVCGLGHGVLPKTPEKNVKYFVDRVREVFSS